MAIDNDNVVIVSDKVRVLTSKQYTDLEAIAFNYEALLCLIGSSSDNRDDLSPILTIMRGFNERMFDYIEGLSD